MHHIIAVSGNPAGIGDRLIGLGKGPGHIGPLYAVQSPDLVQHLVGDFNSHAVEQGGPLGHHFRAGRLRAERAACAILAQAGNLVCEHFLLVQQVLGGGLRGRGPQERGDRLAGGHAIVRAVCARAVIVHQSRVLQLDDHGHNVIVIIQLLDFHPAAVR